MDRYENIKRGKGSDLKEWKKIVKRRERSERLLNKEK